MIVTLEKQPDEGKSWNECRLGTAWRPLTFIPFILCFFFTFKLIEISKEENEHDVIEEMEDRCCGSPGL